LQKIALFQVILEENHRHEIFSSNRRRATGEPADAAAGSGNHTTSDMNECARRRTRNLKLCHFFEKVGLTPDMASLACGAFACTCRWHKAKRRKHQECQACEQQENDWVNFAWGLELQENAVWRSDAHISLEPKLIDGTILAACKNDSC
jgi:hypothetical protein